jgi:HD-GYP domain-containing protein (c-di-GMP phosphodiesterase class II)
MNSHRVQRVVEVVAVGAVISALATLIFAPAPSSVEWRAAAFFAGFGLLATALGYKTSSVTTGSIGFLPFLSILVIAPNVAAIVAVIVSASAAELIVRRAPIKAVFNVAQLAFAEAVAIFIYRALGGESLLHSLHSRPSLLAFSVMVAGWQIVNKLAVSTVVAVSTGRNTREHWINSMRLSALNDILAFPLIYFFAEVYHRFGVGVTSALALPMLGIRQLYKTNVSLQRINEELLQLMVATVEAQDPYTSGHSQRVARYARLISRLSGINERNATRITTAALLHDVGKIYEEFFPILRKPGRLSDSEYATMKTHSAKGAALVGKVTHFEDLVPLIQHHHEAWDGTGYPDQKRGDDIPLGARVIALADTIDAMTTSRPYRGALSAEAVRAEIVSESGRQFDPSLCDAILQPDAWSEIVQELAIATSEYPVVQRASAPQRNLTATVSVGPSVN